MRKTASRLGQVFAMDIQAIDCLQNVSKDEVNKLLAMGISSSGSRFTGFCLTCWTGVGYTRTVA
jgi:hypothetical protein